MSEGSSNGPLPSKHVFLHEVTKMPSHTKVRFLCCVVNYNISEGCLLVEHAYPSDLHPTPRTMIDVQLVLESIKAHELRAGSWLNVIGYIRRPEHVRTKRKTSDKEKSSGSPEIHIQAVMIWSGGAIKVGDYETILNRQKEARRAASNALQ